LRLKPKPNTIKAGDLLKQMVQLNFYPDLHKLDNQKQPFGAVKRWHDSAHLLLKGKKKANREAS